MRRRVLLLFLVLLFVVWAVAYGQAPTPPPAIMPITNGKAFTDLDMNNFRLLNWDHSNYDFGGGPGPGGLPSMAGHNGQFLQTDGSLALWATVSFASLSGKPTTNFGVGGMGLTDVMATANFTWANLGGKPTTNFGTNGMGLTDVQQLDSDLTSIAALSTQDFGRKVLIQPDAPTLRSYIGAGTSSFDGTWASLSGKPTTNFGTGGMGLTDVQAKDGDLTSLAAAIGTNTIYYRSAADTWTPVTVDTATMSFTGGVLAALGVGTGNVSSDLSSPTNPSVANEVAVFKDNTGKLLTHNTALSGIATLATGVLGATSTVSANQGGTGLSGTATGSILYGANATTYSLLNANAGATNMYLRSVGALGVAQPPTWQQIPFADLGSKPTSLGGYGITDALKTSNNLSELQTTPGNPATANAARANLGLAIGSSGTGNVQAYDQDLESLAAITAVAASGSGSPTAINIAVPYRKSANTWVPLKIGAGLSFDTSTDTLTTAAAGGNVSSATPGTSVDGEFALWSGAGGLTIKRPPVGNGFNASTGDLNFVTGTTGSINFTPSTSGAANLRQAVLVDPANSANIASFNLIAGTTPGTRVINIPASPFLSSTVIDSGAAAPAGDLFVKGFDATTGNLTSDYVYDNNLHHRSVDLDATALGSPSGTPSHYSVTITRTDIDAVNLIAPLSAPLWITWPAASVYDPNQIIHFRDKKGAVGADTYVQILPAAGSGNSFNGDLTGVKITEQFADRTLTTDQGSASVNPPGNWSVSLFSGNNNGITIGMANPPLTEAGGNINWSALQGAPTQTGFITLTGDDNLLIQNAAPGMQFNLVVVQGAGGNHKLNLPGGSTTASNGKGVIALDTASGAATKLTGIYYGTAAPVLYTWEASLNYTAAAILTCSTLGDLIGGTAFGGTNSIFIADQTNNQYKATKWIAAGVPAGTNQILCAVTLPIWKNNSPTAGVFAYLYDDDGSGTQPAGVSLADSLAVSAASITNANPTDAAATPVRFTFNTPFTVVSGHTYWLVVKAALSASPATNNYKWLTSNINTHGSTCTSSTGTSWTIGSATNNRATFQAYQQP